MEGTWIYIQDVLLTNFVCKVKYALDVGQVNGVYHYLQVPPKYFSVSIVIERALGTTNLFICNVAEFSSSNFRALFTSAGQYQCEAIVVWFIRRRSSTFT